MDLKNKVTSLEQIRGAMIFEFFSPGMPIILKNSGCEFVIFDMEHGGLSLEQFKTLSLIESSLIFAKTFPSRIVADMLTLSH